MSSQFKSVARPVLVLSSAKLVKNWQIEYVKFLDTNNLKLNLKVYIRHKSKILNKRIEMPKKKYDNTKKNTIYC